MNALAQSFQKKQIFFDFDDTLIDDNYKFEMTSCDCVKVIIQAFETRSPAIDTIINRFKSIDTERVKTVPPDQRFTPSRLSGSWHETYSVLCEEHKIEPKRSAYLLLEGYVIQNFEPPYYVIPHTVDALNELAKTGKYELRVLTSGDRTIQEKKLNVTDLEKYFASTHVLPNGEKAKVLEEAAKEFGPSNVWMVGNSIASDVNAALKVGVNAIHIPRGSWHLFNAEPLNHRFVTVDNIIEVPKALEDWKS